MSSSPPRGCPERPFHGAPGPVHGAPSRRSRNLETPVSASRHDAWQADHWEGDQHGRGRLRSLGRLVPTRTDEDAPSGACRAGRPVVRGRGRSRQGSPGGDRVGSGTLAVVLGRGSEGMGLLPPSSGGGVVVGLGLPVEPPPEPLLVGELDDVLPVPDVVPAGLPVAVPVAVAPAAARSRVASRSAERDAAEPAARGTRVATGPGLDGSEKVISVPRSRDPSACGPALAGLSSGRSSFTPTDGPTRATAATAPPTASGTVASTVRPGRPRRRWRPRDPRLTGGLLRRGRRAPRGRPATGRDGRHRSEMSVFVAKSTPRPVPRSRRGRKTGW